MPCNMDAVGMASSRAMFMGLLGGAVVTTSGFVLPSSPSAVVVHLHQAARVFGCAPRDATEGTQIAAAADAGRARRGIAFSASRYVKSLSCMREVRRRHHDRMVCVSDTCVQLRHTSSSSTHVSSFNINLSPDTFL